MTLLNNTYLPKGNQTDILATLSNHIPRVSLVILNTLLVTYEHSYLIEDIDANKLYVIDDVTPFQVAYQLTS